MKSVARLNRDREPRGEKGAEGIERNLEEIRNLPGKLVEVEVLVLEAGGQEALFSR